MSYARLAVFSEYWTALPPQQSQDEKNTSELPPTVARLLNEVKDAGDFGLFLQDAKTREDLQKEIAELTDRFEKKLSMLWKPDDQEFIEIQNQLRELKKKFEYNGNNSRTNEEYLVPYREGIPLFFDILGTIEKESTSFSEDLIKTTMISLFEGMNLCFPGIHTRAFYAWMQLTAETPEQKLLNIRQEITKKEALLRVRELPLMREEGMAGNEIHFVNSILNYFSESFGLLEMKDSFAMDLSRDTNPYSDSLNSHYWFNDLKEIATEMKSLLTSRVVFEQLAENIAGEIRTFKNDSERSEKITKLLGQYGSDEEFQESYHVITETGELQSEWELKQNIRMTLQKRLAQHIDLGTEKIPRLTPTVMLHQFADESFNYVVEAGVLGSAPRAMPLSVYLLKAATGYSVSLEKENPENEEKLQKSLKDNLITPPALIKVGDSVRIYGMVDGESRLAEIELDPGLIDWDLESTSLSNKHYELIARHHDDPSPLVLLKKINELLLSSYSNTLLALCTPEVLSQLSPNGWLNIIITIKDSPISLEDKKQILFYSSESSISFFLAAVLHGQADAVDRLLQVARDISSIDTNWEAAGVLFDKTEDKTALHIAVEHGHAAVVEQLLRRLPRGWRLRYLSIQDDHGETPLYVAAKYGHAAVVEKLLASLANDKDRVACIKKVNRDGVTPLLMASYKGHSAVVEKLLASLVDDKDRVVDCIMQAHASGATPLFLAAEHGHAAVVEQLLKNLSPSDRLAYIKQPSIDGVTPLLIAAKKGHFVIIEQLLEDLDYENQVDYIKQADAKGATPLFMAVKKDNSDLVEKLLTALPPDDRLACIAKEFPDGRTPLYLAVQEGHFSVVKTLISHALSTDILTLPFTTTPDYLRQFARLYRSNKAVLSAMNVYLANNSPDQDGRVKITPKDIAEILGYKDIADYLSYQIELSKTPVYKYAQEIDKLLASAKAKKWEDFSLILTKHKESILDPETIIDNTLLEQQKAEVDALINNVALTFFDAALLTSKIDFSLDIKEKIEAFKKEAFEAKREGSMDYKGP